MSEKTVYYKRWIIKENMSTKRREATKESIQISAKTRNYWDSRLLSEISMNYSMSNIISHFLHDVKY